MKKFLHSAKIFVWRLLPTRFTEPWKLADFSQFPFYAVLGCHSSGSSALAGALCHLGVFLGDDLVGYHGKPPYYGGEARELAFMLDADLPTTTLQHRWEPEVRKERLGNFIRYQCWRAKCLKTAAAAKFPQLAACENELMELLGDRLRLIICDRPLEESILSLQKRFPEEIPMQVAAHQKLIAGHIESLVKKVPAERVLRVEYTDLIHDIRPTVDRIAQFIRPEATEQERQAAAAHIQPKLRHIVIDQN